VRQLAWPDKELWKKIWEADCEDVRLDVQDRLTEGRGAEGIVDKDLPAAIEQLKSKQ
jgi:hypothetical protein